MKTNKNNEEVLTKQLLLDSAKKIFLECGYQAAPLRKIASEAGFTPGALYGYFSSKEELFYALTDPMATELMEKLNKVEEEMNALPIESRLFQMGSIYYSNIPDIVDILISDRDSIRLIVSCSKGTKYENFLDNIAKENGKNINAASKNIEGQSLNNIQEQTMDVLMDGYIRTLFNLILSDRDRDVIIQCMEMIGKIYERGIIDLMQKED